MISLSESCDCRMDYWQSSPTCSVGNTSKIGWNTHLAHYCIDGWDLILFHLNQLPLPGAWRSGSFFMLVPLAQRQTDRTCPSASVLATFLNSVFDVAFT